MSEADEARLHNHTELVYAPGERALAAQLFEALGCRVVDPGGPYLVALVEPGSRNFYDNVLYASEVTPEQWAFEQALRREVAGGGSLAAEHGLLHERFQREPQRSTHFGIRVPDAEALDRLLRALEKPPRELQGRVEVSAVFRPGDPGCLDPHLVQAFVRTDVCAAGLLALGQHFELQTHVA